MCESMCVGIHVRVGPCTCTCGHAYVHVSMHVCVRMCEGAYVWVCACVWGVCECACV